MLMMLAKAIIAGRLSSVGHGLYIWFQAEGSKQKDNRFDSAQMYRNEAQVGSSISSFLASSSNTTSLQRSDVFFTTKLASNTSYDATRKSIKQSLQQCGLGYIDLFLLHSPYGGKAKRLECWKAVEDAIDDGEIKTGGVSNFGVKHVSISQLRRRARLMSGSA